jgi:DNA polymerase-1
MTDNQEQPILICDGNNIFCRAYEAFPSMDANGEQCGGVVGFLKSIQKMCNMIMPKIVYIAWDTGGGSVRRKSLYKEYKANRPPSRLNRFYGDDLPDTDDNKNKQLINLVKSLKYIPVCPLYIQDCEADDVIAYLCRKFQNEEKMIVSSDKDFYQLLDDKTRIYNLHKKLILTKEDVLNEFRITTKNFALAKSICGDTSDNIHGVLGVGFKTLVKRFPIFGSEQELSIDDIVSYCHTHIKESKVYSNVLSSIDNVRRDWKLVYLDTAMLAASQIDRIEYCICTYSPRVDKLGLIKHLLSQGIKTFDVDSFMSVMLPVYAQFTKNSK